MSKTKKIFLNRLKKFAEILTEYVSTESGEWTIKGFIDIDKIFIRFPQIQKSSPKSLKFNYSQNSKNLLKKMDMILF